MAVELNEVYDVEMENNISNASHFDESNNIVYLDLDDYVTFIKKKINCQEEYVDWITKNCVHQHTNDLGHIRHLPPYVPPVNIVDSFRQSTGKIATESFTTVVVKEQNEKVKKESEVSKEPMQLELF
jgi:hypothetical protein